MAAFDLALRDPFADVPMAWDNDTALLDLSPRSFADAASSPLSFPTVPSDDSGLDDAPPLSVSTLSPDTTETDEELGCHEVDEVFAGEESESEAETEAEAQEEGSVAATTAAAAAASPPPVPTRRSKKPVFKFQPAPPPKRKKRRRRLAPKRRPQPKSKPKPKPETTPATSLKAARERHRVSPYHPYARTSPAPDDIDLGCHSDLEADVVLEAEPPKPAPPRDEKADVKNDDDGNDNDNDGEGDDDDFKSDELLVSAASSHRPVEVTSSAKHKVVAWPDLSSDTGVTAESIFTTVGQLIESATGMPTPLGIWAKIAGFDRDWLFDSAVSPASFLPVSVAVRERVTASLADMAIQWFHRLTALGVHGQARNSDADEPGVPIGLLLSDEKDVSGFVFVFVMPAATEVGRIVTEMTAFMKQRGRVSATPRLYRATEMRRKAAHRRHLELWDLATQKTSLGVLFKAHGLCVCEC